MVDHQHAPRVLSGEAFCHVSCAVRTPVIDHNDAVRESGRLGYVKEVGHCSGEVLLLPVRRHDDGDAFGLRPVAVDVGLGPVAVHVAQGRGEPGG